MRAIDSVALALILAGAACGPRQAPPASATAAGTAARAEAPRRRAVPETPLVTADGKAVHFYSDLVKGKTVLLNFIYTTCTGSCPLSGRTFAQVQELLAREHDRSIELISISMDPEDTPEKLRHWSSHFGLLPGTWTLLSGTQRSINEIAIALTGARVVKGEHMAAVMIGDDAHGRWTRVYGLQSPQELVSMARSFRSSFDPTAP